MLPLLLRIRFPTDLVSEALPSLPQRARRSRPRSAGRVRESIFVKGERFSRGKAHVGLSSSTVSTSHVMKEVYSM